MCYKINIMNIALFDLDNTLIDGDSDYEWGNFLVENNFVDPDYYKRKNEAFFKQYREGTLCPKEFAKFSYEPLAKYNFEFLLNIRERDLGPKKFVKQLEDFVQSILEKFEIKSTTIEGSPGVYVESKKIASIGLRFSKGFSYHGISINVDMDLQPFQSINPCGYQGLEVTQIKDFYSNISLEKVKLVVQNQINKSFS